MAAGPFATDRHRRGWGRQREYDRGKGRVMRGGGATCVANNNCCHHMCPQLENDLDLKVWIIHKMVTHTMAANTACNIDTPPQHTHTGS
jgi:hypothetical protein